MLNWYWPGSNKNITRAASFRLVMLKQHLFFSGLTRSVVQNRLYDKCCFGAVLGVVRVRFRDPLASKRGCYRACLWCLLNVWTQASHVFDHMDRLNASGYPVKCCGEPDVRHTRFFFTIPRVHVDLLPKMFFLYLQFYNSCKLGHKSSGDFVR